MCLIIYKPSALKLHKNFILDVAKNNPDGVGIVQWMPVTKKWSIVYKSLRIFKDEKTKDSIYSDLNLMLDFLNSSNAEAFIHFRKCTSGTVSDINVQPIEVTPEVILLHNGTTNFKAAGDYSDSNVFAALIRPMLIDNPDLIYNIPWQRLITTVIKDNRVVLFHKLRKNPVILGKEWVSLNADIHEIPVKVSNFYSWTEYLNL